MFRDLPVSTVEGPRDDRLRRGRLAQHPWRAFLVLLALQGICFTLVGFLLFGVLRLPRQLANIEAFSTATFFTVSALLGYGIAPFLLGLPKGRHGFKGYLDDIRITVARPVVPLLVLTASCVMVLVLSQGAGSIVYRIAQGARVTREFLGQVFDLGAALPPRSTLLFAQMFSSLEEVVFRGVLLTMLLERHSQRTAIVYSAVAFGLMHLPGAFSGAPVVFVLGQALWAFLFGLFYGYIFVRSGSLLPSMVVHWLSNVFQDPLGAYFSTAPAGVRAFYGVTFGYGIPALLLIPWVKFFADRWLPGGPARRTA
ncbi:MAG: CPBP family intramembrane glutamic endopeptidase [Bacteroidales bacterium]